MKTTSATARTMNNPTMMATITPVLRVPLLLLVETGAAGAVAVVVVGGDVDDIVSVGALRPEPVPVWDGSILKAVPTETMEIVLEPDGVRDNCLGRNEGIFQKERV